MIVFGKHNEPRANSEKDTHMYTYMLCFIACLDKQ